MAKLVAWNVRRSHRPNFNCTCTRMHSARIRSKTENRPNDMLERDTTLEVPPFQHKCRSKSPFTRACHALSIRYQEPLTREMEIGTTTITFLLLKVPDIWSTEHDMQEPLTREMEIGTTTITLARTAWNRAITDNTITTIKTEWMTSTCPPMTTWEITPMTSTIENCWRPPIWRLRYVALRCVASVFGKNFLCHVQD